MTNLRLSSEEAPHSSVEQENSAFPILFPVRAVGIRIEDDWFWSGWRWT